MAVIVILHLFRTKKFLQNCHLLWVITQKNTQIISAIAKALFHLPAKQRQGIYTIHSLKALAQAGCHLLSFFHRAVKALGKAIVLCVPAPIALQAHHHPVQHGGVHSLCCLPVQLGGIYGFIKHNLKHAYTQYGAQRKHSRLFGFAPQKCNQCGRNCYNSHGRFYHRAKAYGQPGKQIPPRAFPQHVLFQPAQEQPKRQHRKQKREKIGVKHRG